MINPSIITFVLATTTLLLLSTSSSDSNTPISCFVLADNVTNTTAAPSAAAGKNWPDFGITAITFFSALTLWFGICFALSKWEDNRSAKSGAGASIGSTGMGHNDGSNGSTSGGSESKYAHDTGFGGGGSSGSSQQNDAGYMPVTIPPTPTGGDPFNNGNGGRI